MVRKVLRSLAEMGCPATARTDGLLLPEQMGSFCQNRWALTARTDELFLHCQDRWALTARTDGLLLPEQMGSPATARTDGLLLPEEMGSYCQKRWALTARTSDSGRQRGTEQIMTNISCCRSEETMHRLQKTGLGQLLGN